MRFFKVSPEVAGGLGRDTIMDRSVHPPVVHRLHYELEGWLGDDIIESYPVFLVTERLREAMVAAHLSGCSFDEARVTRTEQFEEMYPSRQLPTFSWLKISGTAGADDIGLTVDCRLVASENALAVMRETCLQNAEIADYSGNVGSGL